MSEYRQATVVRYEILCFWFGSFSALLIQEESNEFTVTFNSSLVVNS